MRKATNKICSHPYCRKKAKRSRRKNGKGYTYAKKCSMHLQRDYVKAHPEREVYRHLKYSAKKRGIPFTITYEYLCQFLKGTDYIKKKGLKGSSLTIDRDNNTLGYVEGNLVIRQRSSNSQKYWATDRHYKFSGGHYEDVGEVDCPF